jgi:N-methylhydantoinase A
MAEVRIGVDIGGTFTDLVLLDATGQVFVGKVSSTPAEPERAVFDGIQRILAVAGAAPGDVVEVLHGTTVGSNTLLQRSGARTGLLTTKGFRDVLEIGRVRTPEMFDLTWDKPEPLVERRFRHEIGERIAADGSIVAALDEADVIAAGQALCDAGITSVAICFLNSYINTAHERAAAALLRRRFSALNVTASFEVLPEMKEYERTSTTVVNAYVLPVMQSYLRRLRSGLIALGVTAPLLVVNSNGGLAAAATAEAKPVFFISSGPAAGVVGAAQLGAVVATDDLIVFDMGGTTAKAALVQGGRISRTNEYEFRAGISTPSRFIKAGGYMMKVPSVDVAEVGSGAGSIAMVDAGGLLRVGPRSAGADPGPACYGIGGGHPTVTDANVVLGYLNPASLAGGALALHPELAAAAIEQHLCGALRLDVEQAAFGMRQVVNANMARAIKAVTVERGVDPREFTLIAFGGSGPVHACDLAQVLGIRRILFPNLPGVFTALGMLAGDVERYFVRAFPCLLSALPPAEATAAFAALRDEALRALAEEGYGEGEIDCRCEIDLRFKGQDTELSIATAIPLAPGAIAALNAAFVAEYRSTYQYASDGELEVVALRVVGRGVRKAKVDFRSIRIVGDVSPGTAVGSRRVFFDRKTGWRDTPVVTRAEIAGSMAGPLIIESSDTTIVIPPNASIARDAAGNIVASLDRG